MRIPGIDAGLENLHLLSRYTRAGEPANKLFGFAGKHRAGDDLYPPGAVVTHFAAFISVIERKFLNHMN